MAPAVRPGPRDGLAQRSGSPFATDAGGQPNQGAIALARIDSEIRGLAGAAAGGIQQLVHQALAGLSGQGVCPRPQRRVAAHGEALIPHRQSPAAGGSLQDKGNQQPPGAGGHKEVWQCDAARAEAAVQEGLHHKTRQHQACSPAPAATAEFKLPRMRGLQQRNGSGQEQGALTIQARFSFSVGRISGRDGGHFLPDSAPVKAIGLLVTKRLWGCLHGHVVGQFYVPARGAQQLQPPVHTFTRALRAVRGRVGWQVKTGRQPQSTIGRGLHTRGFRERLHTTLRRTGARFIHPVLGQAQLQLLALLVGGGTLGQEQCHLDRVARTRDCGQCGQLCARVAPGHVGMAHRQGHQPQADHHEEGDEGLGKPGGAGLGPQQGRHRERNTAPEDGEKPDGTHRSAGSALREQAGGRRARLKAAAASFWRCPTGPDQTQQGVQKKPGRHQPHQGKNQGKRNAENLQRPADGGIDKRLRRIVGIDQDRDALPPCLRALKTPRPLPWPVVDVVAVAPRVQADAGAFVGLARHLIAVAGLHFVGGAIAAVVRLEFSRQDFGLHRLPATHLQGSIERTGEGLEPGVVAAQPKPQSEDRADQQRREACPYAAGLVGIVFLSCHGCPPISFCFVFMAGA